MTDVLVPQGGVFAVTQDVTPELHIPQTNALAVYNVPAEEVRATFSGINAVYRRLSQQMEITQAVVLAVVRGRVDDPRIRAWTYTLDAHDNYVLRLGSSFPTLVFDTLTEEWSIYRTGLNDPWRAYTGRNWLGGRGLALPWSDVIVGDDGNGALYFLSPDDNYDDDALTGEETPRTFRRRLVGQVVVKPGYDATPCFGVQLFGSIGSGPGDLTVSLEVSDDRGHTYTNVGDITLSSEDYNTRAHWRSLGRMSAPGRLFRITNDGSLKRIDSLDMDDPQ